MQGQFSWVAEFLAMQFWKEYIQKKKKSKLILAIGHCKFKYISELGKMFWRHLDSLSLKIYPTPKQKDISVPQLSPFS